MDQLNQAIQRKIPIIGFDSGVPNAPKGAIYATAATNSYNAAGLAADKMFAVIKDKIAAATAAKPVTIVDFNQDATSQSVTSRGKGFRDEMIKLITTQAKHAQVRHQGDGQPGLHRLRQPDHGKGDHHRRGGPGVAPKDTDATDSAQAILNRVKSDQILGIFCSNEGVARAVLSATNDGSALPKQYPGLVVVGFDAGKAQKAAVKNKYFLGSITQDPVRIGFLAVELAYKAVKGQKVADVTRAPSSTTRPTWISPISPLVYD